MGCVIAVANQKGGVGKTTTAVNLSASLAMLGQESLLVDMDPQGNASSGVGYPLSKSTPQGSYQLLVDGVPLRSCMLPTEVRGLSVVTSSPHLSGIEIELAAAEDRSRRLARALAHKPASVAITVIDCPPSLGLLTINALVAAHIVLVPMQCEYYALEGLSQLVHTVERVRNGPNPTLRIHGVLLTMFDARNNLATEVAAEVRRHFPVYNAIIPRNVRLAEAPSHGRPAVLYDARSRGSHGYAELAQELLPALSSAA